MAEEESEARQVTTVASPVQAAAYREAGHAVSAVVLRMRLGRVSIVEDEDTLGRIDRARMACHRSGGEALERSGILSASVIREIVQRARNGSK